MPYSNTWIYMYVLIIANLSNMRSRGPSTSTSTARDDQREWVEEKFHDVHHFRVLLGLDNSLCNRQSMILIAQRFLAVPLGWRLTSQST